VPKIDDQPHGAIVVFFAKEVILVLKVIYIYRERERERCLSG